MLDQKKLAAAVRRMLGNADPDLTLAYVAQMEARQNQTAVQTMLDHSSIALTLAYVSQMEARRAKRPTAPAQRPTTLEDAKTMLAHSSIAVTRIHLEHMGSREEARSELLKHPTDHDIATGKVLWVDQPYPHLEAGD